MADLDEYCAYYAIIIDGNGETFVGPSDVRDMLVEAIKEHSSATGSSPRFLLWSNIRLSA
ncbi:hypothetical protein RvY_14184 [Ramazzottius varieornatus]|uniref:Uncharacterized protein n=1 Tax=Ramazzottius varieornatus TaxID=947166 RepID=A0A1D1VQF7_RAMVA|nr:hypothetical protein RvY_14184 [Ramazzottius varieornatus]